MTDTPVVIPPAALEAFGDAIAKSIALHTEATLGDPEIETGGGGSTIPELSAVQSVNGNVTLRIKYKSTTYSLVIVIPSAGNGTYRFEVGMLTEKDEEAGKKPTIIAGFEYTASDDWNVSVHCPQFKLGDSIQVREIAVEVGRKPANQQDEEDDRDKEDEEGKDDKNDEEGCGDKTDGGPTN